MLKLRPNKPPWNIVQDLDIKDGYLRIAVREKFEPTGPYPWDTVGPSTMRPGKKMVLIASNQVKVEPGYTVEKFLAEQIDTYTRNARTHYHRAEGYLSWIAGFAGAPVWAILYGATTTLVLLIAVPSLIIAGIVGFRGRKRIRAWLEARELVKWAEEQFRKVHSPDKTKACE